MNMKLEVVVIPVSDVDRAKAFYEKLGWRQDIDFATPHGGYRVLQFTPPGSGASIIFGKGITNARPGSIDRMLLAVDDIDATRGELAGKGVTVDVFHDAAGGLGGGFYADPAKRAAGPDPQRRSYASYGSFTDPDGNVWILQEIKERLPGRVEESKPASAPADADAAGLAELLRETSEYHGQYEKTHAKHDWWKWYGPYLNARQHGSSPEQAATAADRHMEKVGAP
jgi:catechol 2,3-dioxygenase-like lactoylglutathione lyase family enzyme